MLPRSNELYFIPSDTGKPAYVMVDGPSGAFQMTTSPTHDAKLPGISELKKFAGRRPLHFVLLPKEREVMTYISQCQRKLTMTLHFMSLIDCCQL
jgi:hypothetical protein